MKQYELVVLLHPDLEIDVDTPISKIEKLIDGVDGKITKRDNWGKKRLAYPVKKNQFGIYVYFEVDLKPEAVRQLEASLLITEEVIRFLLVKRVETPVVSSEKADKNEKEEDVKKAAAATDKE